MTKKEKSNSMFGKETKSINFDCLVLRQLEKRAKDCESTVSNIVNMTCRRNILGDQNYHRLMMKEYMMKFQEHKYLSEEVKISLEVSQ